MIVGEPACVVNIRTACGSERLIPKHQQLADITDQPPATAGGSDRRSRHSRQRQPRYRERNSARVSSVNLISEHQQPRKLAPHENSLPHASHTEAPASLGENIPASFLSLLVTGSPSHLLLWLLLFVLTSNDRSAFRLRQECQLRDRENSNARPGAVRSLFAQSPIPQSW